MADVPEGESHNPARVKLEDEIKSAVSSKMDLIIVEIGRYAKEAAPTDELAGLEYKVKYLSEYQTAKVAQAEKLIDWKSIWMWPAIGAGAIMILFTLTFKDDNNDNAAQVESEPSAPAEPESQYDKKP